MQILNYSYAPPLTTGEEGYIGFTEDAVGVPLLVCMISLEPASGFSPNVHGYIIRTSLRAGQSLVNLAVPRRLFCFGSLVILDVMCRCLSIFLLHMNIKIGKNRC